MHLMEQLVSLNKNNKVKYYTQFNQSQNYSLRKSKLLTARVDGFFIQGGFSFGLDTEMGVCRDT